MAKAKEPLKELREQAKQAVEQTTKQTLGAVDTYFDFLRQTISSYPSGGTDLGERLKSYADKNVTAAHDYVHKLSQAKDFQDVVRIQAEFMQSQLNAFGEQTRSLGEAYAKSAAGVIKIPSF